MSDSERDATFQLPLTIGVTGHRDLPEGSRQSLEAAVTEVLEGVRRKAPATPFLVLSGLAEGADRVVARLALEKFGATLIAVLPTSVEQFREDFKSADSKAEFDRLLATAKQVVFANGPPPAAVSADQRRAGYAAVGQWIALHSHLLLALWDGAEARGRGGTAEVVRAKLKGRYDMIASDQLLRYDEGGAVAHILTPRPGSTQGADAGRVRWLYAEPTTIGARGGQHRHNALLAAFNHLNRLLDADRRTATRWAETAGASSNTSIQALKGAAGTYARQFQSRTQISVQYLAVATIVAALASGLEFALGKTASTVLGVVAIATACAIWAYAKRGGWQRWYTDYRALAEACRVQAVWSDCGLGKCVADHYHPVQANAVPWIRRAVRTAGLLDLPGKDTPAPSDEAVVRAATAWLDEQIDFFLGHRGVVHRYRQQARKFIAISLGCLGTGLAIAAGTSLQAYLVFMAYGDLQRSYAVSGHLFGIAKEESQQAIAARDERRLKALVYELGRAALVENVSWVLTRRQRGVKPPLR
ncbi:MAG: hypothetical protein FJX11_09120 [Alphaproteobacteria bacterium]|nr:hypothetical protein [Alphaproteobacteria bacterium]